MSRRQPSFSAQPCQPDSSFGLQALVVVKACADRSFSSGGVTRPKVHILGVEALSRFCKLWPAEADTVVLRKAMWQFFEHRPTATTTGSRSQADAQRLCLLTSLGPGHTLSDSMAESLAHIKEEQNYAQNFKTFVFGNGATAAQEENALEKALDWAWTPPPYLIARLVLLYETRGDTGRVRGIHPVHHFVSSIQMAISRRG